MKSLLIILIIIISPFANAHKIEGFLTQVYGDPADSTEPYLINYYLATDTQTIRLDLDNSGISLLKIRELLNQNVRVEFENLKEFSLGEASVRVLSITPITTKAGLNLKASILGTKPWVSVLCKFKDRNDETEALNYFQNMYANLPAGLDHFWREVSYDQIDIVGSQAFNWVTLPKNRDAYLDVDDSPDLDAMFDDCIGAADAMIDFSDNGSGQAYEGINMMFNDTFGCCAWGGGRYEGLDGGPSKLWRVTWNPPWAIHTQGVIAHEMGHGFGLPHTNNSDGDSNPYDSPWDVMSSASDSYSVYDNTYGRLGKHINMSYKYELGWVTDGVGFVANNATSEIVTVEYTAKATTSQPRFIRLPLNNGTHYTIEVRKTIGNYESNLPDNAVIIHHVDWSRSEPAWVVDGDNPPASYADTEGVMWKVGETFYDPRDGYEVTVLAATTHGFQIQINGPTGISDLIFENGFE